MAIDKAVLRCICPGCREEYDVSFALLMDKIQEMMEDEAKTTISKQLVVHSFCNTCVPEDRDFSSFDEVKSFVNSHKEH